MTRDTVIGETPAADATSPIVGPARLRRKLFPSTITRPAYFEEDG